MSQLPGKEERGSPAPAAQSSVVTGMGSLPQADVQPQDRAGCTGEVARHSVLLKLFVTLIVLLPTLSSLPTVSSLPSLPTLPTLSSVPTLSSLNPGKARLELRGWRRLEEWQEPQTDLFSPAGMAAVTQPLSSLMQQP